MSTTDLARRALAAAARARLSAGLDAYGFRLRRHFVVDQIRLACDALVANPSSRQVVLQIWDAKIDLPQDAGAPRSADIPCNVCSLLKVRDGRLEWTQVMRSNDLYRGLPNNVVQFTVLQEVIAGWIGVQVGRYHHWSDSLHVYRNAEAEVGCCEPAVELAPSTDSLATDAVHGAELIDELHGRLVELTAPDLSEARIHEIVAIPHAPVGYQNLLHVLGAESARRRCRYEQAEALIASCTNPQLLQVWEAWWQRTQKHRA